MPSEQPFYSARAETVGCTAVAIIGMSGRFPGADNPEATDTPCQVTHFSEQDFS